MGLLIIKFISLILGCFVIYLAGHKNLESKDIALLWVGVWLIQISMLVNP